MSRFVLRSGRVGVVAVFAALALLVGSLVPAPASAQGGPVARRASSLRVYLDCATFRCDRDRFRREIGFVTWVREPQDGDVHVIMTSERAGGGGQRFVFDFLGRGELDGLEDRHFYVAGATDVEEETLRGLTATLSLGLVRFVALAGYGESVRVEGATASQSDPDEVPDPAASADDPWDFWVFSTRLNADVNREDRVRSTRYTVFLSANRTTEAWKFDFGFWGNRNSREFDLNDSTTFVTETEDWSLSGLGVHSLDEHWSTGGGFRVGTSTRFNRDLNVELTPALEWNYFPWQDASRRRFVVLYAAGVEWSDYEETTIYGKDEEWVWRHRLDVEYRAQEPWGNARAGVEANQILDRPERYSFEFDANVDYRLTRGLSLNLGGRYEIIRDQIYLSAGDLTDEEILVQRRQLETGSRLSFEFGVGYRFGSIFNSVVNSRFPSVR